MSLRSRLYTLWMKKRPKSISPTKIIAITFAAIILLGACLLTLPAASRSGVSCGFRPALFTATSATCVTGLVLYDTWVHPVPDRDRRLGLHVRSHPGDFLPAAAHRPEAAAGDGPGPQRFRHERHRPAAKDGAGGQLQRGGRWCTDPHRPVLAGARLPDGPEMGGISLGFRLLQCRF